MMQRMDFGTRTEARARKGIVSMNGNAPLVSVVVPVYNAASYLHEFCMSLLAQSHRHFEVLMLDDGSTDNSWEILQKYASDPRFRLMQWEKNR